MKRVFALLLAGTALTFTACTSNTEVKGMNDKDSSGAKMSTSSASDSKEMKDERNKNIALQSIEGVNKHDPATVLKDASDNTEDYGDGSGRVMKGKDSLMTMIKAWFTAFPDVKGENLKAAADGEWVVVWGNWSGTWKGDYMGQKATGKTYHLRDADIFRINDEGKITEHHSLSTWPAMAAQIGMKMQ